MRRIGSRESRATRRRVRPAGSECIGLFSGVLAYVLYSVHQSCSGSLEASEEVVRVKLGAPLGHMPQHEPRPSRSLDSAGRSRVSAATVRRFPQQETSGLRRRTERVCTRASRTTGSGWRPGLWPRGAVPLPKVGNNVGALSHDRFKRTRREFLGGATALATTPDAMIARGASITNKTPM
jgi:hypothetical protein